jgi:hypothetical protein
MTTVRSPALPAVKALVRLRAFYARPRVRAILALAAAAYLVVRWYLLLTSADPLLGVDALTYWSAPYDNPYAGPQLGLPGAYLYPPPFIQVLAPVRLLPWELFHALWAALGFVALTFLVGPMGAALAVTFLPFVYRDLLIGNIHLMLAATLVIGLRWPAAWVFPILTKVTPGIGVAWYAVRRQWRQLAVALALPAVIAAVSFVATPQLWIDWVSRMRGDTGTAGSAYLVIFAARLGVALAVVGVAAAARRPSLVPIAVLLSLPILWPDSLSLLLACFPLMALEIRERRHEPARARG